jgi:hypothetical protein
MPVTRDDVWLCLHLYEQRREPELRAARAWLGSFAPKSMRDFRRVWSGAAGAEANRYWRQATSYWEMIASIMTSGALSPECVALFEKSTREWFLLFAKVAPFLDEIRKEWKPGAFSALEAFCRSRPDFEEMMAHCARMAAARPRRARVATAARKPARGRRKK